MIRRMLGAPLGGTTCGGQYGFESSALRPISPPNFGGVGGKYLPSMVVVALGEPGVPVVCCAIDETQVRIVRTAMEHASAITFLIRMGSLQTCAAVNLKESA